MWLNNPHIQTILPKLVIKQQPPYRRELVPDAADKSDVVYDFLDTDELHAADGSRYKTPLLVLFHGMEGSSQSHYARNMAAYVRARGWHFVVAHFRSCGGVEVRDDVVYHAGDSTETHYNLQLLAKRYETIHAAGVSLGGNLLAKYMSDYGVDAICESATVISAPLDLASATTAMESFFGRKLYTPYLLNPMLHKVLDQQLDLNELARIEATQRIAEFDEIFTVPRLGYRSPYDYYRQASALPHLHKIRKPTLIITAKDDPFLGIKPTLGDISDSVVLYEPAHGGHIGFIRWQHKRLDTNWIPETIVQFIEAVTESELPH
ncbi:YheT family hydrolase [Psychrobacter sp. FDAARGOS_221]|uniref:YheT family hydrolase n=1 Tax=Psychrobacter sp. FDAARGOS_221 TaxID=1975705 RepID=UPI000BB53DA2|nr:alpha/beta fold hydrolase [Psychrobacter sp. FDAARGOS_221]PNK60812.1 alpha/beta hydrolase [Psychrobacter sp. FDAARGOS_221]